MAIPHAMPGEVVDVRRNRSQVAHNLNGKWTVNLEILGDFACYRCTSERAIIPLARFATWQASPEFTIPLFCRFPTRERLHVRPLEAALATSITQTLVKTDDLEVIRIVLLAGNELPPHQVPGEITVQCLEGRVEIRVGEVVRELTAGNMLYVTGDCEHALRASENSSLLVTILLKHKN